MELRDIFIRLEAADEAVPDKRSAKRLADYAIGQFKVLKALTGDSQWCFPAKDGKGPVDEKTMSKQVGDRQVQFKKRKVLKGRANDNSLVLAGGAFGEWTPHDMRRTASTVMQRLEVLPDIIDRGQNHKMPGNKVCRHYLHHDFAREKRQAWAVLGAELERVFAGPPEVDRPVDQVDCSEPLAAQGHRQLVGGSSNASA